MRVPPSKETSLVNVPGSNDGARKYGLGLGAPLLRGGHEGMLSGPNRFYEPLAKGFEDVARATALITKDMLMREDQAKVNAAISNFTENELTPYLYGENGEFIKQGEQALGATKRVADFFKDTPQRYTEGLSKNALAAFTEQIGSRKMAVLSSAAQHEAKERNAWEIGTMEAAAASDADFALNNFGIERTYQEYANRANIQNSLLADKLGMSAEQKTLFLHEKSRDLIVGRISRFAQAGNFDKAFKFLAESDLSAEDRINALDALKGSKKNWDNEQSAISPYTKSLEYRKKLWTNDPLEFVAYAESANKADAIGYDSNGGTSYGVYQFSSKQGTMSAFVNYLKNNGYDNAADFLGDVQDFNTGGQTGPAVTKWREAVQQGLITEEMQRDFILQNNILPAITPQSNELQVLIENDLRVQKVAYSTAVQHGGSGGAKLMADAWANANGSAEQFILNLQNARKEKFISSSESTRKAVGNRLDRETKAVLGFSPGEEVITGVEDLYTPAEQHLLLSRNYQDLGQQSEALKANVESNFVYGMKNGDWQALDKTLEGLRNLGQTRLVDSLKTQKVISESVTPYLEDNCNLPIAERIEGVTNALNELLNPENAQQVEEVKSKSYKVIEEEQKKFLADPAGFVARQPSLQDTKLTSKERIAVSLELQKQIGAGLGFTPKALPEEAAKSYQTQYKRLATGGEKYDFIKELKNEYGEYMPDVAQQMELTPTAQILANNLDIFDRHTAEQLISLDEVKSNDIPIDNTLKQELQAKVASSDFMQTLRTASAAMPQNSAQFKAANDLEENIYKAEAMGIPLSELLDSRYVIMHGNYSSVDVEPGHALIIPKDTFASIGMNKSQIVNGLLAIQQDVIQNLKKSQNPIFQASALRLSDNNSCWIMDGNEFVLIDKGTGRTAVFTDGNAVRIDFKSLKERSAKTIEALEEGKNYVIAF